MNHAAAIHLLQERRRDILRVCAHPLVTEEDRRKLMRDVDSLQSSIDCLRKDR